MDRAILTQEGYSKLVEELIYLKTKKRREVADQLAFARSLGDLRENAEYETAKEAKHQLEIRIGELEKKLSNKAFVQNAPEEIIQKERSKMDETQQKMEKLKKQLLELGK